jgi:hypothetical protein
MNWKKLWTLLVGPGLAVASLLLVFLLLGRSTAGAAISEENSVAGGSLACDTLTDTMERALCHFVTGIYSDGLLTNWPNPHPRLEGHFDHAPMRDYAEPPDQEAISESDSMLALYAALIGDQTTFDYLFDVSAPAEIGGTGAPMSSTQESPYYFASPNLCLLHWILTSTITHTTKLSSEHWLANAAGEENRWLEALSIADREFPDPRYRLLANCLAWGLMGATDFDLDAIGNFEDPGTPEPFDDYLMRPYFGWRDDFSDYATTASSNLSYNNLMGWSYATQLGQEPYTLYQTTDGAGGTEVVTIPLQSADAIRIDMTQRGTDYGYALYEVEAHGPFTDTNLFLHAECAASSYQNDAYCSDCICHKALDGDLSTRWSSEQPACPGGPLAPQWLVITPTHPGRVMTITLHWELAHASSYSLTTSWPFADFYSKVLSYTTPLMVGSIQHCGTDLPRVMYDIEHHFYYPEILTPNLACTMDVTVTASSVETPTLAPDHVTDCDPTTRWSSIFTDDEWIAIEFSRLITIDGAILKWETAYGKAYIIEVSNDGVTWMPVYTETNHHGGDDVIQFPVTTTRHIRMQGKERGTEYGYSLWEFEVYYRGGTSSLTALDLARRAAAYAKVSGDTALREMGQRILDFYKGEYITNGTVAAAYDPCAGDPFPGWENGEWPSIMADLAELAAEYGDCSFARQVIEEKLRTKLITNPDDPLYGSVGPSAFENLEVLLALRHVDECRHWVYLPIILKNG